MAWDLGWKKKADFLRMTMLSAGHQSARELPPGIIKILALFRRAAATWDGSMIHEAIDRADPDEQKPLWEPALPFGWWTWFNQAPLYEVQANKGKKGKAMIRIVPLGAPESDGYVRIDLSVEPRS